MTYTIVAIWLAAAVVSMPPLLGVKDAEYDLRLQNGKCLMSQDVGYQVSQTMRTHESFIRSCGSPVFLLFRNRS